MKKKGIPIYEQFTWQGFIHLCKYSALYTLALIIPAISIIVDFEIHRKVGVLNLVFIIYGSVWMLVFFTDCLIPKLRGEK
ncbi:hypothetical protein A3850_011545 [Lewinella sp. 4G2]|nr:hypothetical protein A3850_011545 [Lewinella sp. 4G2]